MDRAQLKQRIVGAIVLVALGVIFIPMILNRDDNNTGITGSNIPEKPPELEKLARQTAPPMPSAPAQPAQTRQLVDKDTPPLPKATEDLAKETTPTANSQTATPQSGSDKSPPAEPAKPRGWVVQIASFTNRDKALHLRDRLRKAKYKCFVESVTGKRGTLYRVRVGPVLKRKEAERLQASISRRLKLKRSLVMTYP